MSTGSSPQAARPTPGGGFRGLRNARLRVKIAGLLLVPLAALIGMASMRALEIGRQADDATRVARLTVLGSELSGLGRLVHDERMAALEFLATPDAPETAYRETGKAVDARVRTVRAEGAELTDVPARVRDRLTLIDKQVTGLAAIRAEVSSRAGTGVAAASERYAAILDGITGYETLLSLEAGRGQVADGLRALAAFSELESAVAEQAAVAYVSRATDDRGADRQRALIAAQEARAGALAEFRTVAGAAQVGMVDSVLADEAVARADQLSAGLAGARPAGLAELADAFGDVLVLVRGAELELEKQVGGLAEDDRAETERMAVVEFIGVLLVVFAAVAIGLLLGRALLLAVRRLRDGALAVANRDLPAAVDLLQDVGVLGDGGVERVLAQTRDPIPVTDRDEFGQVAEAFNMVHREAVRMAAEQAVLRTSLSTMFLSLARRSQSLVDRMIGELDQVERTEEDPKRLARLFELDHLATRMRRNDENLLVLAGAEVGAPRREDALLVDALRAAQSEVELYHRIEFGAVDTDVLIGAAAVNDVVRLIAELLDNATRFSPPDTVVMAHGAAAGDHAVIRIEDRGLGISAEQMDMINQRLTAPGEVDAGIFRLMGFAVIGRLAARHGILVELRPAGEGGTVAEVTLPADIVVLPGRMPAPQPRAASWTRPGPPPPASAPRSPEVRQPVRVAAPPPAPMIRPLDPIGPVSDLDLAPTPDRPPLPSRVPKTPDALPAPDRPPLPARVPQSPDNAPMPERPPLPSRVPQGLENAQGAAASAGAARPAESAAPIRIQMQHSWFEGEAEMDGRHGMPTAGYAPPPSPVSVAAQLAPIGEAQPVPMGQAPAPTAAAQPAPAGGAQSVPAAGARPVAANEARHAPAGETPHARAVPAPRPSGDDRWRTTADEGWQRATAAAAPQDAGITTSGLPKRIPQAQLVPGGVQTTPRAQHRRSPDEVRGLLSAYHRGVQRGRTDGVAETAAPATQAPKEKEQ